MINRFVLNNIILISLILIIFCFLLYSYFFASVVRTIAEDELIKKGFDPVSYVDKIWNSKILPTIHNDSEELSFILNELFSYFSESKIGKKWFR